MKEISEGNLKTLKQPKEENDRLIEGFSGLRLAISPRLSRDELAVSQYYTNMESKKVF
jgi:hypothetical protein